jgi:hypothetical protein
VKDDVPVDSETFLVTDFVNLKIKSAQFFRGVHKNKVYISIFIKMNICIFTRFLEKPTLPKPCRPTPQHSDECACKASESLSVSCGATDAATVVRRGLYGTVPVVFIEEKSREVKTTCRLTRAGK